MGGGLFFYCIKWFLVSVNLISFPVVPTVHICHLILGTADG